MTAPFCLPFSYVMLVLKSVLQPLNWVFFFSYGCQVFRCTIKLKENVKNEIFQLICLLKLQHQDSQNKILEKCGNISLFSNISNHLNCKRYSVTSACPWDSSKMIVLQLEYWQWLGPSLKWRMLLFSVSTKPSL